MIKAQPYLAVGTLVRAHEAECIGSLTPWAMVGDASTITKSASTDIAVVKTRSPFM